MGRRALAKYVSPQKTAQLMQSHFLRIAESGGINLTQYRAQFYEEKMIDILAGLAADATGDTPPSIRVACAVHVLTFARGKVREWIHDSSTIDATAMTTEGISVGEMIEKQRAEVEIQQELAKLWATRTPPDKWPPHIRAAVGNEVIAFYTPEAES